MRTKKELLAAIKRKTTQLWESERELAYTGDDVWRKAIVRLEAHIEALEWVLKEDC